MLHPCRSTAAGALLTSLLAVVLLAQPGCSNDSKGAADGNIQATPAVAPQDDSKKEDRDRELKQPLLRKFDEALDNVPAGDADDLGTSIDEARGILEEADETLTRIKKDNQKGLWRANNPPRRVPPVPPASEKEEESKGEKPEAEKKGPQDQAETQSPGS